MITTIRLKCWTKLSHALIFIGAGHGIITLGILEVFPLPVIYKNGVSFSLLNVCNGAYESDVYFGTVTALPFAINTIRIFFGQPIKKILQTNNGCYTKTSVIEAAYIRVIKHERWILK